MRPIVVGFIIWLIAAPCLYGQQQTRVTRLDGTKITAAEIDQTVTRLMSAAGVTGTGIAIIDAGKVAYSKAYGFRDVEGKLPLTEDSVMAAGSLTKSAVAYLAMQLAEKGQLDLDAPVTKILPKPLVDYPAYHDLAGDPRNVKITPRMLLSHTSGFPNLRWIAPDQKLSINFEPGTRYAYSGEDMSLLQLVLEEIAHSSISDLMRERLFGPLGMTRTSMISEAAFNGDVSKAYDEWGRIVAFPPWTRADAAGSMQTTLKDFSRFLQAAANGELLKSGTKDLMFSPQIEILSKHQFPTLDPQITDQNRSIRLSYGLGWGLFFTPYGKAFFKEGHFDRGFRHYAVMFDEPKKGLIILTNSSNGEGIFKVLLENLLGNKFTPIEWEGYTPYDLLPPRKPPKEHKEITVAPEILDRYLGRYSIPGATIKVIREGARLFFQENDEPRVELFAEGEAQFFSKAAEDVFTFEGGANGKADAMVVHADGRSVILKRTD